MHRVCEECRNTFEYKKGWNSPGRFCSRQCLFNSMRTIAETNCLECGNIVRKKKYCSQTCYWDSLKGRPSKTNTQIEKICRYCQRSFKVKRYRKDAAYFCSHICSSNARLLPDDKVTYNSIHHWVAGRLGRPKTCSECSLSSDNSRQFHWANVSGEYKRDLSDWKRLCVSCHLKFDGRVKATGY